MCHIPYILTYQEEGICYVKEILKMGKKQRGKNPPKGYEYIEPIMEALENELRDKVKESNVGKRNTESVWPVHQINWQRTRYVYDMFYTYKKISREVYDYCLRNKLVDANLIAKWKKPGYERLCSTYVINPQNYKFGTTSICRVPLYDRDERQINARDPTTGCMGCASGKGAGVTNLFGNKYGQNLAAVQIAREKRQQEAAVAAREKQQEQEQQLEQQKQVRLGELSSKETTNQDDTDESDVEIKETGVGESETEDELSDEDDYGPSPAAGIWAGSAKLEAESEELAEQQHPDDQDLHEKKMEKRRNNNDGIIEDDYKRARNV